MWTVATKTWLKAHWKWLCWVLVAIVTGIAYLFLAPLLNQPQPRPRRRGEPARPIEPESGLPMLPPAIQNHLDQAHEEAAIARATASAKAEGQKAQLAEIQKIEDDKERRRRLAEMLRTL